ncbi:hypothetical protein WISP_57080 [Willisornis vidua]|uniref:Uncharacterized protein n=1 Tax=Willisornis vidua TaxID=1566151 RepID=A0ABQ9DHX2_9PASS|nr:hypothetical protein WISP_57080 [Willisornis vidua]
MPQRHVLVMADISFRITIVLMLDSDSFLDYSISLFITKRYAINSAQQDDSRLARGQYQTDPHIIVGQCCVFMSHLVPGVPDLESHCQRDSTNVQMYVHMCRLKHIRENINMEQRDRKPWRASKEPLCAEEEEVDEDRGSQRPQAQFNKGGNWEGTELELDMWTVVIE